MAKSTLYTNANKICQGKINNNITIFRIRQSLLGYSNNKVFYYSTLLRVSLQRTIEPLTTLGSLWLKAF